MVAVPIVRRVRNRLSTLDVQLTTPPVATSTIAP